MAAIRGSVVVPPNDITTPASLTASYNYSVVQWAGDLPLDIARSVLEKNRAEEATDNAGNTKDLPGNEVVCPRCFTPWIAGLNKCRLLPSYTRPRLLRYPRSKQQSALKKLSRREKLALRSYDECSNVLCITCLVCGHSARRLCPLAGREKKLKQPEVVEEVIVVKKTKKKVKNAGLVINDNLMEELKTMPGSKFSKKTKHEKKVNNNIDDKLHCFTSVLPSQSVCSPVSLSTVIKTQTKKHILTQSTKIINKVGRSQSVVLPHNNSFDTTSKPDNGSKGTFPLIHVNNKKLSTFKAQKTADRLKNAIRSSATLQRSKSSLKDFLGTLF